MSKVAELAKMIHSIPRQIAYISTFIPLEAGDAIGILRNGIRNEAN